MTDAAPMSRPVPGKAGLTGEGVIHGITFRAGDWHF